MNLSSKKTAGWAAFSIALCGAVLFSAPAEARRYKKKIVHPAAQQRVMMQAPFVMGGDRFSNMMPEYANQATQRQAATPRLSRAARRAQASATTGVGSFGSFGGGGLVSEARRYLGTNPTGMSALWCARFMNMVLERSGRRGTGSNMASSFASYGTRISGPQVGAIAVMSRGKRGGHVGIVSGIDASGNPIIISGNHNRRVAEATYSRGRVYAYVMPN
jgi:uncharacterized protein (TIGR02594 family)